MTHGSPAAFCIADDGGGLIEGILWRETEDYQTVGCHRGRCERKKDWSMRKKVSLMHKEEKEEIMENLFTYLPVRHICFMASDCGSKGTM